MAVSRTQPPTATSPWNWSGSPRRPPWPPSRWMGRGDKNGADGAAVDAMRIVLATVPMDGIVVIGEGEKDEAPMLFNGERDRRRHPAADRHRRRPDRRHHAHRARAGATPSRSSPSASGARCSTPARASTWRRSPSAPRPPASIDITATADREPARRSPRPRARSVRDVTVVILDRPRHDELIAEVRADRRPHPAHPRRRRRRRHLHRLARLRRRHPVRHRRHARGRHRRRRPEVHGRRDPGPLWPRNDDEREAALAAGYDLDAVLTTDDLVRGDNCFFAATGITDGELLEGRPLRRPRRHHPVAGDALASRARCA